MKVKNEREQTAPQTTPATRVRPKRFTIEKLEERIAPKKGGKGTHNCSYDSSGTITWGCSSY
jgi:hypothetical protein